MSSSHFQRELARIMSDFILISPIQIEGVVKAAIVGFSGLLLVVSILAYKRTGIKKMAFAAAAFSLFAVQLLYEFLEESVLHMLDTPYLDLILSSMTLAILVIFFFAIIKKDSPKMPDRFQDTNY